MIKYILFFLLIPSLCFATQWCSDANCQGCWLMDIDEDPLTDSSQNSNTGALLGPGEPNYATASPPDPYSTGYYEFDDGDDKITITEITIDEDTSFVAWFKSDTLTQDMIAGREDTDNYFMVVNSTTIRIQDDGSDNLNFTVPEMSTETWYHLAITKDASSNWELFLNANESSTGDLNDADPFLIGMIGQGYTNDNYDWAGDLDEVAWFDKELSPADITDIYNNGLEGAGAPAANNSQLIIVTD